MNSEKIISAGNNFAGTFIISFLFVYFAIIEPHFAPKGLLEQHADEALQEIEEAKKQLKLELSRIRLRHFSIGSRLDESIDPKALAPRSKFRQDQIAQLEKDEEAAQRVHEKMVQLDVAQQGLEKTKLEKKQYSIPLVSISLDEETLLKFFPVLVLGALIRLYFYRRSLLRCALSESESFPLWMAPLAYGKTSISFKEWILVNFLGLSIGGTVLLMTLRFIFSYARENFSQLGLVAIDALLIAGWAAFYFFLVTSAVFSKATREHDSDLEAE